MKGFVEWFKDWNGFLTAKDKMLDNVEWHAFVAGLIASAIYYMPFEHAQEIGFTLMGIVGTTALGVEAYRIKKEKNLDEEAAEKLDSLKDQIEAEGQYALGGLLIPHAIHALIILMA